MEKVGCLELDAIEEVQAACIVVCRPFYVQLGRHGPTVLYNRGVGISTAVVKTLVHIEEMHLIVYLEVLTILLVGITRCDGQSVFQAAVGAIVGVLKVKGISQKDIVGVVSLAEEETVFGIEPQAIEPCDAIVRRKSKVCFAGRRGRVAVEDAVQSRCELIA